MNKLKQFYSYIYDHNIWNKVAATLIAAFLLYIVKSLFTLAASFHYADIWLQVTNAFTVRYELWKVLLFIAGTIVFWWVINKLRFWNKKREPLRRENQPASTPPGSEMEELLEVAGKEVPHPAPSSFIFQAFTMPLDGYDAHGEGIWDSEAHALVGPKGLGNLDVQKGVISIERFNVEGRFIIKLKRYYTLTETGTVNGQEFVSKNIFANNPRWINFSFECRCIKGDHRLWLVLKKHKTDIWLNSTQIDFNEEEWLSYSGAISIPANEDFVIELHHHITSSHPGIFQIRGLIFYHK